MFVESQGGDLGGKLMGVLPGWAIYAADLIFAMYVLINLMGCLWLFTGITEYHRGGHCWLESVGEHSISQPNGVALTCLLQVFAGGSGMQDMLCVLSRGRPSPL